MYKKYKLNSNLCFDEETRLENKFNFLIERYDFKFKICNLGNMVNKKGEFVFYGPLNCYYFYNDNVCINFINLF